MLDLLLQQALQEQIIMKYYLDNFYKSMLIYKSLMLDYSYITVGYCYFYHILFLYTSLQATRDISGRTLKRATQRSEIPSLHLNSFHHMKFFYFQYISFAVIYSSLFIMIIMNFMSLLITIIGIIENSDLVGLVM